MPVIYVLLTVLGLGFAAVGLVGFLGWRARMRDNGLRSVG
jgi:hypothetical protein